MKLSTLCYLDNGTEYLMMHRNRKTDDPNYGKWIGVGGKLLENESPDECLLREVLEETGLKLLRYRMRGIITFVSYLWETEYMFLYTADAWEPSEQNSAENMYECDEGMLEWVPKADVMSLKMWPGDREFLRRLEDEEFFTMKLVYEGDGLADIK